MSKNGKRYTDEFKADAIRLVREVFPRCSRQRLYGIQKENQLYSIRKRKFKATTNFNHKLPVAENLLITLRNVI